MFKMPLNFEEHHRNDVLNALDNSGCCFRCCLRFLSVTNSQDYDRIDQKSEAVSDLVDSPIENLPKKIKPNTCVTCLGLLQDLCNTSAFDQVLEKIKATDYEITSFGLALSFPPSLLIRQRTLLVHLTEAFPSVFKQCTSADVISVKEVWKWIAGPYIQKVLDVPYRSVSPFEINVNFDYDDDNKECETLYLIPGCKITKQKHRGKFRKIFTRSAVEKTLMQVTAEDLNKYVGCPPKLPNFSCKFGQITCSHTPVYLAGRYNKFSRKLSQTPWFVDGEKLMEFSVQELICDILVPKFKAQDVKFSSSGREDVDVRTLGKGRPFALEIINPQRCKFSQEDITEFQNEVNASTKDIAVNDLQLVPKEEIHKLKDGEENKTKTYSALCYSSVKLQPEHAKLLQLENVKLLQKTPIRVLHRRPLATREKMIHMMKAEIMPDMHHFNIIVTTQAGTYVKEFVHGDFGRTTPNLCSILNSEVDILELDVEAVDLNWPPAIENSKTYSHHHVLI